MRICPVPWADAFAPTSNVVAPLRPVVFESDERAQIRGSREKPKKVCGSLGSFEIPRPLTDVRRGTATLIVGGTAVPISVDFNRPLSEGELPPGKRLASHISSVSSWMGTQVGNAISIEELHKRLVEAVGSDEPPMSLIVDIADRHRSHLEMVCRDPRVQLRRRRELQLVDRVRQLDAASLRWLARQPGQTIAERAGPRERILSVRRYRSCDTLENRVLVDTLRRSISAAQMYKRMYGNRKNSDRLRRVADLERSFCESLRDEWVGEVRTLDAMPVPNYVLLSDRRYAPIWKLWQRLVKQEQLFQSLEAWLPRVVAELTWIGVLESIRVDGKLDVVGGCLPKLFFRPEFEAGEFLFASQPISPLVNRGESSKGRVDFVRGDQLRMLAPQREMHRHLHSLSDIRPDFAFVRRSQDDKQSAVAVWTLATWNESDDSQISGAISILEQKIEDARDLLGEKWIEPIVIVFRAAGCGLPRIESKKVRIFTSDNPVDLLTKIPCDIVELVKSGAFRA